MFKLKSKLKLNSSELYENKKNFEKLLESFKKVSQDYIDCTNSKSIEKHRSRNKFLARERIDLIIDDNTPFLELSPLAAIEQYKNQFPSAGIITGIGVINGIETVIVANDATIKGGTYIRETIKKHLRAQQIALENGLPCLYMVDSGGIFLPEQARVFADREDFGRIFYNQAKLSAEGISQISIVFGSCTAGGAYIPAMSDETIIVEGNGTIFIGGPPLVKAATGEEVNAEELGGAHVHTTISGTADHYAENEIHALRICRNIFESLLIKKKEHVKNNIIEEPDYDPSELYSLIPVNQKTQIDPREIIMRIVDGSYFHEFKENYATTIVTGFSRIMGYPVGIIANYGVIFSETALKASHFIELCTSRKIPIIFLQNITGFIVGKEYENRGIARDGAKLVHAVANAQVPKFTVIIGGSFGAGNYAMAGRAYDPRLLFMWPNAKISVMGGQQAAEVLVTVKEDYLSKSGSLLLDEEKSTIKKEIKDKYEHEGSVYYSTSRLWDDGIIDPVDTRYILGLGISMSMNKKIPDQKFGVFRM